MADEINHALLSLPEEILKNVLQYKTVLGSSSSDFTVFEIKHSKKKRSWKAEQQQKIKKEWLRGNNK